MVSLSMSPESVSPESVSPESVSPESLDLPTVMERVADVEGWMTPGQASTLFDAARRCPDGGRIVEIGSFRGRSTIVLASAAAPGVEIVAIDPHAGNDRGPQEIDGYADEAAGDHEVFNANLAAAGVTAAIVQLAVFFRPRSG